MSAYDDVWSAIAHLRGAKTKLTHAKHRHRSLSSVQVDVLTLMQRRLFEIEKELIGVGKLVLVDQQAFDASRAPMPKPHRRRAA